MIYRLAYPTGRTHRKSEGCRFTGKLRSRPARGLPGRLKFPWVGGTWLQGGSYSFFRAASRAIVAVTPAINPEITALNTPDGSCGGIQLFGSMIFLSMRTKDRQVLRCRGVWYRLPPLTPPSEDGPLAGIVYFHKVGGWPSSPKRRVSPR